MEGAVQFLTEHFTEGAVSCYFSTGFPIPVEHLALTNPGITCEDGRAEVLFETPFSFAFQLYSNGTVRLPGLSSMNKAEEARLAVVEFLREEGINAAEGELQQYQVLCSTSYHDPPPIQAVVDRGEGVLHPMGLKYHDDSITAIISNDGDIEIRARTFQDVMDSLVKLCELVL